MAPASSKKGPAAAPSKAPAAKTPAAPATVYAPKRTFSQWADDLSTDSCLCFSFIVAVFSGKQFDSCSLPATGNKFVRFVLDYLNPQI